MRALIRGGAGFAGSHVAEYWRERRVLVTGGASFIGSHLVEALLRRGARLRVVDDLSSGKLENIRAHVDGDRVEFTL